MRILLLGGRGVFGTEFFNLCKKNKILIKAPKSIELNIVKIEKVKKYIQKYKPTHIVNSAVFMGIDPCHDNYKKAFEVNALSVLNLSKICNENNITFIQTSTHAVFDGNKSKPYNESDQPLQNNVYGATKYSAESFVSSIWNIKLTFTIISKHTSVTGLSKIIKSLCIVQWCIYFELISHVIIHFFCIWVIR